VQRQATFTVDTGRRAAGGSWGNHGAGRAEKRGQRGEGRGRGKGKEREGRGEGEGHYEKKEHKARA